MGSSAAGRIVFLATAIVDDVDLSLHFFVTNMTKPTKMAQLIQRNIAQIQVVSLSIHLSPSIVSIAMTTGLIKHFTFDTTLGKICLD